MPWDSVARALQGSHCRAGFCTQYLLLYAVYRALRLAACRSILQDLWPCRVCTMLLGVVQNCMPG